MHDYHQQLVSRALMQTWIPQTNHFAVQFDLQGLFAKFAKVEVNQVDLNRLPPLNLLVPVKSVKYGYGVVLRLCIFFVITQAKNTLIMNKLHSWSKLCTHK